MRKGVIWFCTAAATVALIHYNNRDFWNLTKQKKMEADTVTIQGGIFCLKIKAQEQSQLLFSWIIFFSSQFSIFEIKKNERNALRGRN